MESEDYNVEGEEEIERQRDSSPSVEEFTETVPELSAAMGGWLDLGTGAELDTKSDSETEPDEDSDNEDVRDAGDEPEADEDLFQMPSTTTSEESPVEVWRPDSTRSAKRSTMIRSRWVKLPMLQNMIRNSFFDTCKSAEDAVTAITNK